MMGTRRARAVLVALGAPALAVLLALSAGAAFGQTKPAPRPRTTHAAPAKKPAGDAGAAPAAGLQPAAPMAVAAPATALDAGVAEAKTLDGGTHVFKFNELDIEGRLKSPQLVYFLRRVRAEFAAGDLGHRSFMREMSETRKESSF